MEAFVTLARDVVSEDASSTRIELVFVVVTVEEATEVAEAAEAAAAARFFNADRLRFSLYCAISISICFNSSRCDWSAARLVLDASDIESDIELSVLVFKFE